MKKLVTLLLSLLLTICIYSQEYRVNQFKDNKINRLLDQTPDFIDSTYKSNDTYYVYIWFAEEGHKLTVIHTKAVPFENREKWMYNLQTRSGHRILLNHLDNNTLKRFKNYHKELKNK